MKLWLLTIVGVVSTSMVLAASVAVAQTPIFSDDLSVGTGWTYSHIGGTSKPVPPSGGGSDNVEADFGFDYSQFGIPEAPNSDAGDPATQGLRLADNLNGFFDDEGIAVVYEDASFAGQYTVQVDAWLNWAADPGAVGTTEFAGVFAGFDVAAAQASDFPAQSGAGFIWDTDGDCGNCDYILQKDAAELDLFSGQYFTEGGGFPGNQQGVNESDGPFPTLFPSFDIETATNGLNGSGAQPAGAAGFQWVTVTAAIDASAAGNGTNGSVGTATFTITNAASGESQLIGTVDNSVDDDPDDGVDTGEAPVGLEGAIALMMVDFFSGAPNNPALGFILFDNVRVFDGFLSQDLEGDYDGNGFVGQSDLDLVLLNWGDTSPPAPAGWVNQVPDGLIGQGVLDGVLLNWGSGTPPLTAVPEPTTAVLMTAFGLAANARRRR